ncbi:MAG TPA: cytidylate kinase-like family protein [Gemmataceae bacterium]|nr:cytidylate kinase-like family protein [Gemmataceae bacterium]
MNVLTVSREYGAGGGEVARRLAEALGWELLDRELLHRAAAAEHVPDADLERLDEQAIRLIDRFRLHPPHQKYIHGLTEAVRQAAASGKVVLVGRGTRQLLGETPGACHLRLVAPRDWRARRMAEREGWTMEQALARCEQVERSRERFTRYFFGPDATRPEQYDLVVNTGRVPLDDVVAITLSVVRGAGADQPAAEGAGPRVLTLSRELGACDGALLSKLGARLSLRIYDRELLEREAARLGVTRADLETVDEQPIGFFQRVGSGGLPQRYLEALRQILSELADQGDVVLIGRGGNHVLREHPRAYHVRLVAPPDVRVQRIMGQHWVRAEIARKMMGDSDTRRRRFTEHYFGHDWADPLEYHLTANAGRLGSSLVALLAVATERLWTGPQGNTPGGRAGSE